MPPLTAGHLKKVASGIRKNPVKYFALGIHRSHGYKKFGDTSLSLTEPASNKKENDRLY